MLAAVACPDQMQPTLSFEGGTNMADASPEGDLDFLMGILKGMEAKYPPYPEAWSESPFRWVLTQPSATKGAIARQLIMHWAKLHGAFMKQVSREKQIYLELGETLIQVKFSTLWDSDYYRFQQIRDHAYDYCLCLGIAPYDVNAWLIPKSVLDVHVIGTRGQHTGSDSGETWWLEASPSRNESWLEDCGGELAVVGAQLRMMAS